MEYYSLLLKWAYLSDHKVTACDIDLKRYKKQLKMILFLLFLIKYYSLFLIWAYISDHKVNVSSLLVTLICGLYNKSFMTVIYDRNDSGQYYKTMIMIVINDHC